MTAVVRLASSAAIRANRERLAAILEIADAYTPLMDDPEQGGEHWGDCPLGSESADEHTYPECYDWHGQDSDPDGWSWTWNPEKAAKVCICSVGSLFRIAQLAKAQEPAP